MAPPTIVPSVPITAAACLKSADAAVLAEVAVREKPRHGYEVIKAIEQMVGGDYSPSPGVIYPTLTLQEELAYAAVEAESGGKKLYRITAEGQAFLAENQAALELVLKRLEIKQR
eukprot:gene20590-26158_t